jgi:hypothetical protein
MAKVGRHVGNEQCHDHLEAEAPATRPEGELEVARKISTDGSDRGDAQQEAYLVHHGGDDHVDHVGLAPPERAAPLVIECQPMLTEYQETDYGNIDPEGQHSERTLLSDAPTRCQQRGYDDQQDNAPPNGLLQELLGRSHLHVDSLHRRESFTEQGHRTSKPS